MVEDVIMAAVFVGLAAAFWFTRKAKSAGDLPGMPAANDRLRARLRSAEHGEAFEDEKPQDY